MNRGRRSLLAVALLELGRAIAARDASRILRVAILDQWMTREPSTPPRRTIAELERVGFREGRNIVLATQPAKVLRGVLVAQIPFERPEKFVMHVSRKTAKALGIGIPQEIYLQADHVYDDWQDDREPAAKKMKRPAGGPRMTGFPLTRE